MSLGLDGCEVRLCDIRVPVCARVSRVSVPAPPGVFLPVLSGMAGTRMVPVAGAEFESENVLYR